MFKRQTRKPAPFKQHPQKILSVMTSYLKIRGIWKEDNWTRNKKRDSEDCPNPFAVNCSYIPTKIRDNMLFIGGNFWLLGGRKFNWGMHFWKTPLNILGSILRAQYSLSENELLMINVKNVNRLRNTLG